MSRISSCPVKRQIVNAFLALVKEKSYMDITVTDVVNRANIARASFYRNFGSINDIIDVVTDELCESFIEDIYPTLNCNDERKWREFLFNYFYHFALSRDKLLNVNSQNMTVFLSRIDSHMKNFDARLTAQTVREKYVVYAKLGLINSIAKKWIKDGMQETPEEIIDYIMSFIILF